uniref:ATP synthase F0 subunit 8 n=1 Tax=Ditylenchus dipsaci TaxID=166011 RepID=A0A915DZ39_9BILA
MNVTQSLTVVDYFSTVIAFLWFIGGIWFLSVTLLRLYVSNDDVVGPCDKHDFNDVAVKDGNLSEKESLVNAPSTEAIKSLE